MQGRNTIEEVLCLSAQRGYTVFYRNREESNILSDIVIAHPTSIAMIRTLPYVQYASIGSCRDDSDRKELHSGNCFYRHIDQNVLAKLTEMLKDEEIAIRFVNGTWHKLINETDECYMVETANRAEREHSVLKLWLSTCHGDLDTVFLNIDSLIEGQIAEIKTSLEISKLKEKYSAKSNLILKNISNNISHLALKKI
ncbi:hypothetical protein M9H77_18638 [Catharanthus roseus]|uniref:Uncharacterized protein n=1 Tax=Catharanthus roseus TaxID=4058 RepID=A0ACC0B887_CATRO|nr:hypothetical protein M9H77_18638 [Catharanthus roseus]